MLDVERAFFDSHRAEWLARFRGRIALVKGEQLVGTYATMEDALSEGARRFGLDSFLVRPIEEAEPEPVEVPAYALGILRGDSTPSI